MNRYAANSCETRAASLVGLAAGVLLVLGAPNTAATADADSYDAIDWYAGSVEEAFAEAEQAAKPLFLYWGAVWCPPCNALKSTLFEQPEFIAKTRNFVAVFLDGDTERAQVWGERHDAVGYPSVIVFDASGRELTRLPGTLTAASFMAALDDAQAGLAPAAELAQVALRGERPLSDAEVRRLAYHSWYQDRRSLAPEQYLALFRRLQEQASGQDRALTQRVQTLRLSEAAAAGNGALAPEDYAELLNVLDISAPDLDNLMMFSGKLAATFAALAPEAPRREELSAAFTAAVESVLTAPGGSKVAPLFALGLLLELERLDDPGAAPGPELQDRIVAAAERADAAAETQQERQSVIFYAYSLLHTAGENERAQALLERELEISEEPYYFMFPLATLRYEAGDVDGAARWMERYYREAYGVATRLQHGVNYARRLMLWKPQEADTIIRVAREVLAEVRGQPDALANRNLRSLGWLTDALTAWRDEHHTDLMLSAVSDDFGTICEEHAGADSEGACMSMRQRLGENEPRDI